MRTWLAIATLLSLAGAVVATTPSDYAPMEESRCWECHGQGLWTPVMEAPTISDATISNDALTVTVSNPWLHDLQRVIGVLEPAGPIVGVTSQNDSTSTQSGSLAVNGAQYNSHPISVPNFAQGLEVTVTATQSFRTDLLVRLVAPDGTAIHGAATAADKDAVSVASVPLAVHGKGAWAVEVYRADTLGSASYTIEATSLATPSDGRWTTTRGLVGPDGTTPLRFDIAAGAETTGNVRLQILTDAYYDHRPPTQEADDLDHLQAEALLELQNVAGTLSFVTVPFEVPAQEAPGPGPLALAGAILIAGIVARRPGPKP